MAKVFQSWKSLKIIHFNYFYLEQNTKLFINGNLSVKKILSGLIHDDFDWDNKFQVCPF